MAQQDGLQIDQDLKFQRRDWIVQRVGWVAMAAILGAGALGFLGSGPFSTRTASLPDVMRVEYQRFSQYQTPETLRIHLEPGVTAAHSVRLSIDRRYLDGFKIESIMPPADRVEERGDRLVHVFSVAQPGHPLTVQFRLQPEQFGRINGSIAAADGAGAAGRTISFWQFVYP